MIIRDAERKDAESLDMLLSRLIRDEARYDGNLNRDCRITDNYCSRIGLEGHKLILLEEDGQILGFLYGFVCHVPGVYRSPIAVLDALFIDENHRQRGYASILIEEFRSFATRNGACRMELKVVSDNIAAISLYRKFSFTETKKHMKLEL